MKLNKILFEAQFDIKRRKVGEVNFPTSSLNDQNIKNLINIIAKQTNINPSEIQDEILEAMQDLGNAAKNSPLLYDTMMKNAAEAMAFDAFWKSGIRAPGAPEFNNVTFRRIINQLRIDYDEFFPLRSFIDRRSLVNPVIEIVSNPKEDDANAEDIGSQVSTAAAAPDGTFYFNKDFMQALIDYAHVKQLKPKGERFKSNGGTIPDEYAWIEFLIMHEFMHYSNDDFYYQKVIPNADPDIINWVGDFRTNYLLTKSGFEPLPLGLFNDEINYDRQAEYVEMYNTVKEEFEKLSKKMQIKIKGEMTKRSDDHRRGNEQGKGSDIQQGDVSVDDLDKNAKEQGNAVDKSNGEGQDQNGGKGKKDQGGDRRGRGKGGGGREKNSDENQKNPDKYKIDVSKIIPRFTWGSLISRFIKSGQSQTEETYAKPARRSITTMDIVRQQGAGAIKPAEVPIEFQDMKLMLVIDNSGSMTEKVKTAVSNIKTLLKHPSFRKSAIVVSKFSSESELWKVLVAANKAGLIKSVLDKKIQWNQTADYVLNSTIGRGTVISQSLVSQIIGAFKVGYNVILFSDSDMLSGNELQRLVEMITKAPRQMYVIFDSRATYIEFRRITGINTANISHF